MDLFPNALFSLFTLSLRGTSPPNLPLLRGGICWVSPLELLSSLLIKPLSGYAAHLSPCKGEKERGLLILNWRIYFYFIIVALAIFSPFHLFTFPPYKLLSICYFFNVWEHFSFSFFVTNRFLHLAKYFRLFGQKSALKIPKHRFRVAKA